MRLRAVPDRHPAGRRGRARLHAGPDPHLGRAAAVGRGTSAASARRSSARRSSRASRRIARGGRGEAGGRRDPRSRRATRTAASARWPASTRRRCRCSWSRTGRSATSGSATSTRATSRAGSTTAATTTPSATSCDYVHEQVAPVVAEAVRRSGGIELKPIMRRALNLGDELHSRNTAATMLFERALLPALLDIAAEDRRRVDATVEMLASSDYFFLRLSMAAAKAIADGAHGIAGSARRDGARDRLRGVRDPRQRPRRPVVHRAARRRRGEAVRGPHRRRDLVDGRRELHHGDGRPGRLRAGGGAGPAELPGRLGARRCSSATSRCTTSASARTRRSSCRTSTTAARRPGIDVRKVVATGRAAGDRRRHRRARRRADRRRRGARADGVLRGGRRGPGRGMSRFAGRVAFVTGAASGIGQAIARRAGGRRGRGGVRRRERRRRGGDGGRDRRRRRPRGRPSACDVTREATWWRRSPG